MQPFPGRVRAVDVLVIGCAMLAASCSTGDEVVELPAVEVSPYRVELVVVDEDGAPIPHADVSVDGESMPAGADGSFVVRRTGPVLAIADAGGYLAEPVVVSRDLAPRHQVQLFARRGPDGATRVSYHFVGDTMMGRRYVTPTREGTAVLGDDAGAAAREIVAHVAPLLRSADMTSANLETVVGNFDRSTAYPGKRFLLQMPPEALTSLDEMGVDLVTLGNNHAYDWLEEGIVETIRALDAAGLPHPGAGLNAAEAGQPAFLTVPGSTVATLSYTTVTGDFVNDHLPTRDDEPDDTVTAGEEWQYEFRSFSYGTVGAEVHLAPGEYRAGDVWRWFDALAPDLSDADEAPIWAALTSPGAFPELQDWVARRGHGGAARFLRSGVAADVAAARERGADFVIVQIHGGFQFSEVASSFFTRAARASVEAGADLVIGHHPHVIQGFEWYDGTLIAYSLGNFLFDQDFLATFPSFVLRTVYADTELLEARIYPTMLDDYRPVAVAGEAAARILTHLDAGSVPVTRSRRLEGEDRVKRVIETDRPGEVELAAITRDGNAGVIGRDRPIRTRVVTRDSDGVASLPVEDLVLVDDGIEGLEFGHDLLEWGAFDDWSADGSELGAMHWELASGGVVRVLPVTDGGDLAVELAATSGSGALLRPVARVTRYEHGIFDLSGEPVDSPARYSVRMRLRRSGDAVPYLRVDVYHFDDTNPVRDPVSDLVRQVRVPIEVAADAAWYRLNVELPSDLFARDDKRREATAALLYVGLERGAGSLAVDDVEFLEWREADRLPPGSWAEVDALRGPRLAAGVRLTVS